MSYVCLRTADILPRGSKNNVLQWFVQFLLGLECSFVCVICCSWGLIAVFRPSWQQPVLAFASFFRRLRIFSTFLTAYWFAKCLVTKCLLRSCDVKRCFQKGAWQGLECPSAYVIDCYRMSYVCLRLAGILPRGSKNNVLQWFVQFLPVLPVSIHMSSFCWAAGAQPWVQHKNIRVARCDTWSPWGGCLKSQTSLSENRKSASGPCKGVRSILVTWKKITCLRLGEDFRG